MLKNNYKYSFFELIIWGSAGAVLLFIIAPIFGIFLSTTGKDFFETVRDSDVHNSIWLTLWISMAGTIFCSIFAIPFAFLLARKEFLGKNIVSAIINIPIIIPHSAAGIAILGVISRNSLVGKTSSFFGLNLVGHPVSIAIAMAFVSIPFLINSARNGFSSVPEKLEKAALNLGASPTRVFFTISFPLAIRSILSGFVMMWARGLSEFGAVIIVAYHPMVTPVLIYERFTSFGLKYARPVSALFILICLIIFILFRVLINKTNVKS